MERSSMKSFDINAPSRVNPSANSRPVIVGHRPIMADPMMRPAATASPAPVQQTDDSPVVAASQPAMTTHVPKVIQVTDAVKEDLAAAAQQAPPAPAAVNDTPPTFPAMPPAVASNLPPQPQAPSTPVTPATAEEIPGANPQMPAPPSSDSPAAAPAAPEQLPQVPEQDLSHIPHVPVSHKNRRGGLKHILLWLLIFVFLGGSAAYLLIDAGFIGSSINLPFHILST